jgi:hypothetical protein
VRRATRSTSWRHTLVLTSGMNSRNASRATRTSNSASSSSSSARTLGVGRFCASSSNHEVESPQAPATSASSRTAAILFRSVRVAARSQASSPITNMRNGVCPIMAATFTVEASARSASTYSGNVVQLHGTASANTDAGMSST